MQRMRLANAITLVLLLLVAIGIFVSPTFALEKLGLLIAVLRTAALWMKTQVMWNVRTDPWGIVIGLLPLACAATGHALQNTNWNFSVMAIAEACGSLCAIEWAAIMWLNSSSNMPQMRTCFFLLSGVVLLALSIQSYIRYRRWILSGRNCYTTRRRW